MSKIEHSKMVKYGTESIEIEGRIKTLELKDIKNMFSKDAEVKLKVKTDSKVSSTRIVQGKVIQKNNFLIAIKTKTRVESFQYLDFLTNRVRVIG